LHDFNTRKSIHAETAENLSVSLHVFDRVERVVLTLPPTLPRHPNEHAGFRASPRSTQARMASTLRVTKIKSAGRKKRMNGILEFLCRSGAVGFVGRSSFKAVGHPG